MALDGFAGRGYAATSLRWIAQSVGIQDSALYRHFPSKQAIFDAIVREAGGPTPVVDALAAAPSPDCGPRETLSALAAHLIDIWDRPRSRQFVSMSMREGGPGAPLAADAVDVAAHRTIEALSELFKYWREAGQVRDDIELDQLTWELIAPLSQIRALHLLADSSPEARARAYDLAHQHVEFFLTCVTVKEEQ